MKKIIVSTQMMIHDQERFKALLQSNGFNPDFVMSDQYLSEKDCLALDPIYWGWIAGDDQITQKVLAHLSKNLKIISKWGTGVDSIDLNSAQKLNIEVKNSPGAFKDAVGEQAVAYTLALTRGLFETHEAVKSFEWPKYQYKEISDYKIGIIGFGAIGNGVASKLRSFDANIYYYDPFVRDETYKALTLDELQKFCDIFIITASLNKSTRNLLGKSFFKNIKPGSFLINVSRGQLVDEVELIKALKNKIIRAAALDVYNEEPLNNNSKLRDFKNIIFGSHNANNTYTAVEKVHQNTINNLKIYLQNDK